MPDLTPIRDALNKFVNEANNKQLNKDRNQFVSAVAAEVIKIFAPLFQEIATSSRLSKEDIKTVAEEIAAKISSPEINMPEINVPDVYVPDIKVPEPKVTVNVPDVIVPEIKMPDEMDIKGWVRLQGVDLNNPLPVQLRDAKGNPVKLFENLTQLVSGGGGGIGVHNVRIGGFSQSAYADYINADGRIKVSTEPGSGGLTDTELRAAHLDVQQLSGSIDSVNVLQYGGNAVAVGTELNTGVSRVYHVSDIGLSTRVNAFDTSLETKQVSGFIDSVFVTGFVDSATVLQARTTNPTAVADGADVRPSGDKIGRTLMRPVQVRDLLATAYVSITTGTETTLLAGVAATFLDLIYVMGTNSSDAAVTVDLRSETGAGIVTSIRIPANGTAGVSLDVPIPQNTLAAAWTADLPDITGTTVTLSALFSKEI